jgi:hypothetical protein
VGRGLYRLAEASVTELSSLADVSKRVPHAVICLLSALQLHGLTTEVPHAVWILIDRHARLPKLTSPRLEVVRASGAAREHGIETRIIDGVNVQLTTPAKTVADCLRSRRHVGLEVARAALEDYLSKRKGSIGALVDAARAESHLRFHASLSGGARVTKTPLIGRPGAERRGTSNVARLPGSAPARVVGGAIAVARSPADAETATRLSLVRGNEPPDPRFGTLLREHQQPRAPERAFGQAPTAEQQEILEAVAVDVALPQNGEGLLGGVGFVARFA